MSRNLKIAAAVVVAMGAGSAANALVPSASVDLRLYVAGASAQRDTFQQEITNICQSGTQHNYRASPTAGQDFRAYSCTLLNAAPVPTALRNKNVVVYYRSEGGSIYGVGSLAKNLSLQELVVNTTVCPGNPAGTYAVAPQPYAGMACTGCQAVSTTTRRAANSAPARSIASRASSEPS